MFGGGSAKLKILKPKVDKPRNEEEEGVVTEVREATRKMTSGKRTTGSRSTSNCRGKRYRRSTCFRAASGAWSVSLRVFALISVSPPPFLVLDEMDAPLDERNARRFAEMLKEFSKHTQFIVVTHNRATMESADILYGVTLDEDGTSKVVSLKFEE